MWNQTEPGGVSAGVTADAPADVPEAAAIALSFDSFYSASYPWVVKVAYLLTGDRGVAEDLAQESFARTHAQFTTLANPGAFVRVCVVNASRSWHRRRGREARRLRQISPPDLVPFDALELLDALDRLPYRQKAVLVLRYYADLSEVEIAAALECRPGTVKSLAARGLARLRKEIEE